MSKEFQKLFASMLKSLLISTDLKLESYASLNPKSYPPGKTSRSVRFIKHIYPIIFWNNVVIWNVCFFTKLCLISLTDVCPGVWNKSSTRIKLECMIRTDNTI